MIERNEMRPIYCPVCGKYLLKAKDGSEVDAYCERCNSDIIAAVTDGMLSTTEIRRNKLLRKQEQPV